MNTNLLKSILILEKALVMVHVPCRTDEMSSCSGISYDRLADERNSPYDFKILTFFF